MFCKQYLVRVCRYMQRNWKKKKQKRKENWTKLGLQIKEHFYQSQDFVANIFWASFSYGVFSLCTGKNKEYWELCELRKDFVQYRQLLLKLLQGFAQMERKIPAFFLFFFFLLSSLILIVISRNEYIVQFYYTFVYMMCCWSKASFFPTSSVFMYSHYGIVHKIK